MSAHLLHEDFLRFVDALAAGAADPWEVYQEHYLAPNRAALEAWWDQCMGLPREVWIERVRSVRTEDYGLLREVAREADLEELTQDAVARCEAVLPMAPEPEVYFLVGFFSPDGFAFQVEGEWAIGIGMERLGSVNLVPILVAHEYGHCHRRRRATARTLGERLVDEGFAVELSARAFPERPTHDHLLMHAGQVAAMGQYERLLWQAVKPFLDSQEEAVAARVLYGRTGRGELPSRAGIYLGWRMVSRLLESEAVGFDASAAEVLAAGGDVA